MSANPLDAEGFILAAAMVQPPDGVIEKCEAAGITYESFTCQKNRRLFVAMSRLHAEGVALKADNVFAELADDREMLNHAIDVEKRLSTTALVGKHIRQLRDSQQRRELRSALQRAAEACDDTNSPAAEIARNAAESIAGIGSTSPRCHGFTIWNLDEFAKFTPSADDALLGDVSGAIYWRDGELALLLGPGGVGKSRVAANLAVAQILGETALGFKTFGPARKWLLTGNENGIRRTKGDLGLLTAGLAPEQLVALNANLRVQALVGDEADSMSLDDPDALRRWRATAAEQKPDVLIVDPWESIIMGADCNDSAATRESVRLLRSIFSPHSARFTLAIVHHAREGAEAARKAEGFDAGAYAKGSKTLRSMARFGINIAPEDPNDGGRIVIACGKINNARKFTTRGAILDEMTGRYGINPDFDLEAWQADVEGKSGGKSCSVRDVWEAVRSGKHATGEIVATVKAETGASQRSIKRRLSEAVAGKYLRPCPPRGHYTLGDRKL